MRATIPDGGSVAKFARMRDPCSESSIFSATPFDPPMQETKKSSGHHPPAMGREVVNFPSRGGQEEWDASLLWEPHRF